MTHTRRVLLLSGSSGDDAMETKWRRLRQVRALLCHLPPAAAAAASNGSVGLSQL